MPPKKGKKGKKQDEDWGDDKGIEEKMKNLMVAADSDEEVKPAKKGKSLTPVDANNSSDEEPPAPAAKSKKSSSKKEKARKMAEKLMNEDESDVEEEKLVKKGKEKSKKKASKKEIKSSDDESNEESGTDGSAESEVCDNSLTEEFFMKVYFLLSYSGVHS